MSCQIITPTPTEDLLSSSAIATGDSTIVSSETTLSSATALSSSPFDTIIISFSSAELSSSSETVTPESSSNVVVVPDSTFLSSSSTELSSSEVIAPSSTISSSIALSSAESSSAIESSSSVVVVSSSSLESSSSIESSSSVNPLPPFINANLVNAIDTATPFTNGASTNSLYSSQYAAWKAFDKASPSTQWISGHVFRPGTGPANLMYTFGEEHKIVEYRIASRFDSLKDRAPKNWVLQGSNSNTATAADAIDDTQWATIDTQNDINSGDEWGSTDNWKDTIAFTVQTPGIYTSYRLCVTAVNGSSVVDIIDMFLMEEAHANITIPTTETDTRTSSNGTYGSSYPAWHLFDGASTWTQWMSASLFRPGNGPANISYSFDDEQMVTHYTLTGRYDSLKDRLPKNWIVQGTNSATATINDALDATTWTTVDTRTDITTDDEWNSETSVAELTLMVTNPGSYTTYRICITAVNGSSIADLIEISFAGIPAI